MPKHLVKFSICEWISAGRLLMAVCRRCDSPFVAHLAEEKLCSECQKSDEKGE